MIFFPAIDLKDGSCVRLLHGDMEAATVFNDDPGAQAQAFAGQGAEYLHVVDLNGAFAGKPVNADAVVSILKALTIPVQLGGGIRTLETMEYWLSAGIKRVILGTVALTNPDLVRAACRAFPGQIAIGIDAREGFVATEGWADLSKIPALDLAKQFEDAGAAALIHTDIGRDGAMQGPNLAATLAIAKAVTIPVIVSGGVSSMDDIRQIAALGTDVFAGVISGRAVYDGQVDVAEATRILKGQPC
ncbi:MAG: 1-(5-phosphoribosyl)-5-[(5-phosphoribosylamino)methylideneamino]imidazole-4-carboxamide isomerase [Rhodospirillales bacterium]|nr:1-(5-phosphoribosyl)-5-[(5-phosphoribosylamino)methylideneamino]imidazole-4-carboxamide isomerase [Rhodospirillales bacterium]